MNAPLDCSLCPRLCESRRAVVNGKGSLDADIMVVAQNPGAKEEQYGYPLYERAWSGEKLRFKLMPLAGIKQEEVRYENIVRCRPPRGKSGDLPPSATEIKNCRQFLVSSIQKVRPKFIICLGAPSLKWFFPEAKLDAVHGAQLEWEVWECNVCQVIVSDLPAKCDKCDRSRFNLISAIIVPMYHPAAATPNRNPRLTITMDADWNKLGEYLNGNKYNIGSSSNNVSDTRPISRLGNYKLVTGKELVTLMKEANVTSFAFDYETTECMWKDTFQARRASPIGYSVAWEEGVAYYTTDSINHLKPWLENPDIEVIAHNAKFEWIVSKNCGFDLTNMQDTKLMAYLLRKPSTSLKDLAWSELGIQQTRYEDVDWNDIQEVTQYGAADSDITLQLYNRFLSQLAEESLTTIYEEIELPLISVLGQMEMNGIIVDPIIFAELEQQLNKRLVEIDDDLLDMYPYEINWRSNPQKQNALYGDVGGARWESESSTRRLTFKEWSKKERESENEIKITLTKIGPWIPPGLGISTKFGKSADIPTLCRIEESEYSHSIIPLLIERASIVRALSGEVVKLPELVQEDGRVHTSFHQV